MYTLPKELYQTIICDLEDVDVLGLKFSCKYFFSEIPLYCPLDLEIAILEAVQRSYFSLVQWLMNEKDCCPESMEDILSLECSSGNLEMVKWLINREPYHHGVDDRRIINAAVCTGNIELLDYLWENNFTSITQSAVMLAGGAGHIDVLYWIKQKVPEMKINSWRMDHMRHNEKSEMAYWMIVATFKIMN